MRKQAFLNDGLTQYNPWDYDINGTWDQNRYTDWQKELLGKTAQINDVQATLTGGSEQTQFLLSGTFHKESTVFPGAFLYKKGGSQFNLNHRSPDDKFKATVSASYTLQDNNQPAFDLTYEARSLAPNAPALYLPDGSLNWENGTWENPLRNLNAQYKSTTKDLIANTVVSYEILPDLYLKSSMGYTHLSTLETRTAPSLFTILLIMWEAIALLFLLTVPIALLGSLNHRPIGKKNTVLVKLGCYLELPFNIKTATP
jgi:hypothetical protein